MVLLTAERFLGSRIEAEDIVQEVFCRVFRKAKTLRDPERLRSFIYSFAIRVLKAELRRRRVRGWFPFLKTEEPPDVAFRASDFESRDLLAKLYRSARSSHPARPSGVRPPAHGVDDCGRDRHDDGPLDLDGEAIDGTRVGRLSRWVEADPELADLARGEHWGRRR